MSQIIVTTPGTEDKRILPCDRDELTVGRASDNDIVLPSTGVSRRHASIVRGTDEEFFVVDHGSDNGTVLNGTTLRARERYLLRGGDTVTIDGHHLLFVRQNDLEQSFNEITDSEIMEVKLLKKVLRALDHDTLPSLEVMNGTATGKKIFIRDDVESIVIGRDPACELMIEEYAVSRRHATLTREAGTIAITDLKSKNGVYVNQRRITTEPLHDGDRVALGTIVCMYRNPREVNLEAVSADVKRHRDETQQAIAEKTARHRIAADALEDAAPDDAEAVEHTASAEANLSGVDEPAGHHANVYPTPQPARSWLDRMSAAEMGLLWAGIIVFLVTSILLVRLVM